MSVVHPSRGRLAPASPDLLSEVVDRVPAWPARTLGDTPALPWEEFEDDYDAIRDRIARVDPRLRRLQRRVRERGGFVLPHPPRDERRFPTPDGKAQLSVNHLEMVRVPDGSAAAADRPLPRSVQHHHLRPRRPLPRHPPRPARRVRASRRPGRPRHRRRRRSSTWSASTTAQERRAPSFRVVAYPTARGCCAAYFPEANVLVPLDSTAEVSNTPTSKSIVVRLEPLS